MEKNLRILVVEDDAIIGMDIEHRVKKLGYEVCGVADTAAEALDIASGKQPDLALMAIRLRGAVDGIEAARMLRDRFSVPVIFITAYSDMKMRSRALDMNPLGYIVKPLREVELKKTLEAAEEKIRAG